MKTKEKTYLTIGIFVVLAAIGTTYFIAQDSPYDVFYCNDTNYVGMCHKISHDADNLSKRCYYDLNNTRKYSYCRSGWILYEGLNVTGEPINDSFNYFEAKFDKKTISKLKEKNITEVQVSSCIQTKPGLCIAILDISEGVFKELLINPDLYNSTEELELKIIEEAKKELAKLVAEEPEVFKLTNPIKIDLKVI